MLQFRFANQDTYHDGIQLGVVVSDVHMGNRSVLSMVKALTANQMPHAVLRLASRRLNAIREELLNALQRGWGVDCKPRIVFDKSMQLNKEIEQRIVRRLLCKIAHAASRTTSAYRENFNRSSYDADTNIPS